MQRYAKSILLCAAAFLFFASSPALAQQSEEVPSMRTEDVRTSEAPTSPVAGTDAEALCREARSRRDAYLEIWKSQFLKRNRMDRAYFDTHVQVRKYDVECSWVSGLSFRVEYTVKFDWAAIEAQDQLVVMLYESESAYRHLPLKRDHFFDEAEIALTIDKTVFFSEISSVKPSDKLAFPNHAAALEAFRAKAGTKDLDNVRLAFYVPGNVPRIDGHPYMLGRGVLNEAQNQCVEGHVNLVTGKITTWANACIMHSRGVVGGVPRDAPAGEPGSAPPYVPDGLVGKSLPPPPMPEPEPSKPERPAIQRVSGGVLAGKAIRRPQAPYPDEAREAGIQGAVVVEVTISEEGAVLSARAVSGHPLLRDAAVDAARGWKFSPTTLEGYAVKVIGTITFNFRKG